MRELKDFDSYWLAKGQETVNGTFVNLNKHLTNYNNYLKALLGFYTLIGLTANLITSTTDVKVYLAFVLPYIILFLAMFKISVGQSVQLEKLDLRSPLQINDAYGKLVLGLKKDITQAKKWVALATIAILIGGSVALYSINIEKEEREKREKIDKRKDKILNYEDENLKEYKKAQKINLTRNIKENTISIAAKFSEDKKIALKFVNLKKDTVIKIIDVPKLCDYKLDVENIEELIETTVK
ncbi:hypothetical protein [Flavivirga rizhaonensis]|uniref:Uncharacterized protein n=1 Tax=Flavivirga rizhaonensis TaxID=2559571 RepID=A0A4S1E010_9FLAO|nr:hypothetical protein [Flavivirga rizhaonensis]TGV03759.1 hypothetical protein EM932_04930 [Flavivirga rizhaonensis]